MLRVSRFTSRCSSTSPEAVLNRDWGGSGRLTANSLRLNFFSNSSGNAGRTYERWDESINLKPE
ncbi:MAG: hypothetical protein MUE97_07815 [Phycisphaerales bacterium]|jgi:hypothetical protein|nr:hypothetical protein [Phycisphaerales bacterium]